MSGSDVFQNTVDIQQNTALILQNTADIQHNAGLIQQNTLDIQANSLIKCKITMNGTGDYVIYDNTGFIPYSDGAYIHLGAIPAAGRFTMIIPLTASLVYCTGSGSHDATGANGTYMVAYCWKQEDVDDGNGIMVTQLSISTMQVADLTTPVDITAAGQIVLIVSKN